MKFAGWFGAAVMMATCGVVGAQCCPGVLEGKVSDPAGAPISGATISLTCHAKDGDRRMSAKSDANGGYRTAQLTWEPCDVTVSRPGWMPFQTTIKPQIDTNIKLDAKLYVGVSGPVVESSDSPLETSSSVVATTLASEPMPPYAVPEHVVSPVAEAARAKWEYGAFFNGGVGLEDRTNFTFLSAGAQLGRILTPELGTGLLKGNLEYAVQVIPYWQSFTPKFPVLRCPIGATSASKCYGPVAAGGTYHGASIEPIIVRYNFTHGKKIMPWIQAAGGVLYTSRKYPAVGNLNYLDPTETGPNADTSVWNFTPQGGVGAHYFLKPGRSMDLSVNGVHISSSSLGDKNPGVNVSLQCSIGYTWWK